MKNCLIFLSLFLAASKVFAQGTLVFANLASGVNVPGVYYIGLMGPSGQRVTDPAFLADLYFSTSTNAPTDSLQAAGFNVPFSTITAGGGGYFLGGTRTVPGATGSIVAQVRVWDSRLGSTFEAVRAQPNLGFGYSNPFIINLAIPPAPAPPLSGLSAPFPVYVIPEPSALALSTLGLGILLMIRHGKSGRDRKLVAPKNPRN
jgi:hypothetical protein